MKYTLHSQWDHAASALISELYIMHPVKLYPVRSPGFTGKQRESMKPKATNLCYSLCVINTLFYQVSSGNYKSLTPPPSSTFSTFFLSFFSFSTHPLRWRDGSQRQFRDDVSPLPWASPAGASHPQSERGPGKGERSRSSLHRFTVNLRSHFHHALSSQGKIYRLTSGNPSHQMLL